MELIFEIIFEVYLELMMYIVPEQKASSKKYRNLAYLFVLIVLFGVFALFVWGCVLITDHNNELGMIPISIAVVISVIQIIAGFILHYS